MWAGLVHLAVVGKTAYPHRDRPIVVPSGWSLRVEGWGLKTVATGNWGLGRLDAECTLVWAITDYRPSCLLQPNWQDVLRDREHFTHFIFISVLFIFFLFLFFSYFFFNFIFVCNFLFWLGLQNCNCQVVDLSLQVCQFASICIVSFVAWCVTLVLPVCSAVGPLN